MEKGFLCGCLCFFFAALDAHGFIFKHTNNVLCPEKPNLNGCRFNVPCDPTKTNPCGCVHACCAKSKTYFISAKSSGNSLNTIQHPRNIISSYFCFKKGECNQRCTGMWKIFNNIDKCGCGVGMKCTSDNFFQPSRCKPEK